jgi:hypothetical protein
MSYRFDRVSRLVELLPGVPDIESQAGALCRRHGDAMVLPRGWVLDDQREPTPRLFNVDRSSDATDEASPRARRRRRSDAQSSSSDDAPSNLFVVPTAVEVEADDPPVVVDSNSALAVTVADVAGTHPDTPPDETQAMPWIPMFDDTDNLGGMLDATTPMLRRAFGTDHRHRSR